ncbi:MAG: hypothetical protein B6242_05070 [Anaerolineaceae bacterium 4572_78]|nr:MAG: hypothetical protein B6242_05070 [Anaerolineaceae bacterium 4572_78]
MTVQQVYDEHVTQLSIVEIQKLFIMIEQYLNNTSKQQKCYAWTDIAGTAPYPMFGEDAQAWVSRTRQEDTEIRESQWSMYR